MGNREHQLISHVQTSDYTILRAQDAIGATDCESECHTYSHKYCANMRSMIKEIVSFRQGISEHLMEAVSKKHQKFRELASNRTDKALEAIERIGNLSNRQLYEWDIGEVRKILKALRDEVAKVEARFEAPNTKRRDRFTL